MDRIQERIRALVPSLTESLPGVVLVDYGDGNGTVIGSWDAVAIGVEQPTDAALLAVVLPDNTPRRARKLIDILNDIAALTTTQQAAIWTNLTSGTPPLWTQGGGANEPAMLGLHWSATNSGATAANLNIARRSLAAIYVLDHPTYLVNPSWSPLINVPGDEIIPT